MARDSDGLCVLLPQVAEWFRSAFHEPTPPQARGWPAIASGQNTLIFAPTGSGKTLAAFLACLDHLWRHPRETPGVRILYVSPLKALNHDIERNLQGPLEGILAAAKVMGKPLPALRVAVRTGDTSTSDRQKLIRKPPDILITTPESLHLMLTSRARETLRAVSHVIVDEIHALCPNKRGVFLALLLERLEAINPRGFVRVGLSATQRPLEEVARYLGGLRRSAQSNGTGPFEPRPVTIIDTGQRKDLDLEVTVPSAFSLAQSFETPPAGSVWPAIERRLLSLIESHRSTIIFANNRRVVERVTANLNELANDDDALRGQETADEDSERVVARAHHGSLSLDQRRATEEALKRGELPSVVATASLELGIDMGAVDLVCQVESPGSIARGLQRVGRAGHVFDQISKGRMIAKTLGDLLEQAALAKAMHRGEVEALRVPTNCLDVLAQQVVACVAVDRWDVPELFDLVRGAYPYRDLTPAAFESVLNLVSGRFQARGEPFRDLRPRVSWDRVHNRLHPLPGTAQLALVGGGTIPDTGQYPILIGEGGPRIGELDEEFVHERRVGETFVFGTSTWRIDAIEPHRVVVSPAEGRAGNVPFWKGEQAARTPELGEVVGALCRELAARRDEPGVLDWLQAEYHLDELAARSLRDFVARQHRVASAVPDDRTVLIETFRDPVGELGLAVLTPFGGRLHQALKLALQARLRQRLGISASTLHGDSGVLIRLPQIDDPPLNLFDGLTAELAETLIREEVGESALFGLRFRQNAGRALLMPRPDPGKRTPLWLQRLRAKDLLQVVRQYPDFPIVVETYRECLNDDLDLPRLRTFLNAIQNGSIQVVYRQGEIPSPFASDLILRFTMQYIYEWDEPRRADRPRSGLEVDENLLDPLLDPEAASRWLDPSAVSRVNGRLRSTGHPPRTADEMVERLRGLGDLTTSELAGPMQVFLSELAAQGRACAIELPGTAEPHRWISTEEAPLYASAFANGLDEAGVATIVKRFLHTHALVGLKDVTERYPIDPIVAAELLERWADDGGLVRIEGDSATRWADRRNLQEVQRLSIALRRREAVAVPPEIFADYVARRQHVHPVSRWEGAAAVGLALEQLQGFATPADLWETELLPRRIRDYRAAWLDEWLSAGGWLWRAEGREGRSEPRVAFVPRDFGGRWPSENDGEQPELTEARTLVQDHLTRRGASFASDIAVETGVEPSRVREALEVLMRVSLATNDRFDPLRPGARSMVEALASATSPSRIAFGRSRPSPRRSISTRPEGRWSLLPAGSFAADPETGLLTWAAALFERYGVLTRETAALDPWAPPWRELAPLLARAEWRGELRRGYFVEGLSGVQYALPEAADALARLAGASPSESPPFLISTLDPANLYGAGAPLDVALLEGGTARLNRTPGNYLVLCGGRPVLIIEGNARRLTGLASASEAELRAALALVPSLAGPSRRVLKVETYNAAPTLASPAAPWLADLGFVRDHPGMAFYPGW
ncbi:MAG TPA: DEAD/DEAH box helicase [Isosphaeraceae bacterium]|jgi:ATP-dependent Lhr-like helicase|nr:DEAD/DEAH box helicase [Isosphaeraceae bacterium]